MHDLSGGLILGYHGCHDSIAQKLLYGEPFKPSNNGYDWLGPGIYFWEANPARALEFAKESLRRKGVDPEQASLVGAVIAPGYTLDLLTKAGQDYLLEAYEDYLTIVEASETPMPSNTPEPLLNWLDCAVIRHLHVVQSETGARPIQMVRGVFIEGNPLYETSAFYSKTHIQIAVCDPSCIKGVFQIPKKEIS